ncbi:MAG: HD domain-containing protein [Candidatus Andersenbacteria bacterium]|nr:HD domain-containing protein [Candidatus Andersenbacteria bacterium]
MIIKDKIWGEIEIKDKLIEEIILDKDFQRMKKISQFGIFKHSFLFGIEFNRFEHSVGVYYLLKKFRANEEERLAGLLHDISHGAFSHVLDIVFADDGNEEYADSILLEKISDSNIGRVLKKSRYDLVKIVNNCGHTMLDKELPDIAADRIDYMLRDPLGMNPQLIRKVTDSLVIKNREFVFNNSFFANLFANHYYNLNKNVWSSVFWTVNHKILADIIGLIIDRGYAKKEDLFLKNDEQITKIIEKNRDKDIDKLIEKMKSLDYHKTRVVSKKDKYDYRWKKKNRFIDPKILIGDRVKKLSDINPEWKLKLEYFKKHPYFEYYVKLK